MIFPTLYGKDSAGGLKLWEVFTRNEVIVVRHGKLGGKIQEKQTVAVEMNVGRSNHTSAQEQADTEALAKWVKQNYGKPLPIRLDTNGHGYILNPGRNVAAELKAAGVDIVSVSLNAGDKETYNEICRPIFLEGYKVVLDFIQKAKLYLDVEVSAVRLPEVDMAKAKAVADDLGVLFKVREYIPCFY